MYERFFGLNERPFDLTADPRFLHLTAKHREALYTLRYGIFGPQRRQHAHRGRRHGQDDVAACSAGGGGQRESLHRLREEPDAHPFRVSRVSDQRFRLEGRQEGFEEPILGRPGTGVARAEKVRRGYRLSSSTKPRRFQTRCSRRSDCSPTWRRRPRSCPSFLSVSPNSPTD